MEPIREDEPVLSAAPDSFSTHDVHRGSAPLDIAPSASSIAPVDLEGSFPAAGLLDPAVATPLDDEEAPLVRSWYTAALAPITTMDRACGFKAGDRDIVVRAATLAALALCALSAIISLFRSAPALVTLECSSLSPTSLWWGMFPKFVGGEGDVLGTARRAWLCADAYQRLSPEFVLTAYCAAYVGMQAFAIPGPLILSIIGGALWGVWKAQVIIALCATGGASLCYALSNYLARPLLERAIPGQLADTRAKVSAGLAVGEAVRCYDHGLLDAVQPLPTLAHVSIPAHSYPPSCATPTSPPADRRAPGVPPLLPPLPAPHAVPAQLAH